MNVPIVAGMVAAVALPIIVYYWIRSFADNVVAGITLDRKSTYEFVFMAMFDNEQSAAEAIEQAKPLGLHAAITAIPKQRGRLVDWTYRGPPHQKLLTRLGNRIQEAVHDHNGVMRPGCPLLASGCR